jgi:hypothetical protein
VTEKSREELKQLLLRVLEGLARSNESNGAATAETKGGKELDPNPSGLHQD